MSESELYAPVKAFLEGQGYAVKGEVKGCDVVAVRDDEPPVIVELKTALSFALILQAVDRLAVTDSVYVAFRIGKGQSSMWRSRRRAVLGMLRRLGLGLLTVSTRDQVVPLLDPESYRPRPNIKRKNRLLKEFFERVGDPETGGSASQQRLTAYRQDALRCVGHLHLAGVAKVSVIREATGVERIGEILSDNHYGWFERERRAHYRLSPKGESAKTAWAQAIETLKQEAENEQ